MIATILTGIGATITTGGFITFMFKRQQNQIDSKADKENCDKEHAQVKINFDALQSSQLQIVEALQGKPGETGLVAMVEAIRKHQQNGG